ncbi:MAG TPA: TraR/DksA C4-type zinc finger protein [Gemmatimonadales bacterium]
MALTDAQRKQLEQRLQEERARTLRALGRSIGDLSGESERERSGDLSALPLHPADQGTDTMQLELDASNAARMSSQLTEIDAALERLYRTPERFGVCEDTGGDIPFERLDVIPWARTCDQADAEPPGGAGRGER